MPVILQTAHASPPHRFRQDFLGAVVAERFSGIMPGLEPDRIRDVFAHSRIGERAFLMPLDWYLSPHTIEDRNRAFLEQGFALLVESSRNVLSLSGIRPDQVGQVVFVTTTGMSAPSLDSYLVNALGLSPSVSRLPVWGLGCAAGSAGIARAFDYCLAHPAAIVLVASLETCSLNFIPDDLSRLNLVAMSLFADCSAAVLVAGDAAAVPNGPGVRILDTRSHFFPGTTGLMGWDVTDAGFRLVLTPELPEILRSELGGVVDAFLEAHGLSRNDVVHVLAHPGGAKIMDAVTEALGLSADRLRIGESVLRDFGNVSSASVLLVLERWLAEGGYRKPGYGLIVSFGPGFAAEMVLVRS